MMVKMLVMTMLFHVSACYSILPCLLRQRHSDASPVSELWRVVDTGSCELGAARHSGQTGLRERRCQQVIWLLSQWDTLDDKIRDVFVIETDVPSLVCCPSAAARWWSSPITSCTHQMTAYLCTWGLKKQKKKQNTDERFITACSIPKAIKKPWQTLLDMSWIFMKRLRSQKSPSNHRGTICKCCRVTANSKAEKKVISLISHLKQSPTLKDDYYLHVTGEDCHE